MENIRNTEQLLIWVVVAVVGLLSLVVRAAIADGKDLRTAHVQHMARVDDALMRIGTAVGTMAHALQILEHVRVSTIVKLSAHLGDRADAVVEALRRDEDAHETQAPPLI